MTKAVHVDAVVVPADLAVLYGLELLGALAVVVGLSLAVVGVPSAGSALSRAPQPPSSLGLDVFYGERGAWLACVPLLLVRRVHRL